MEKTDCNNLNLLHICSSASCSHQCQIAWMKSVAVEYLWEMLLRCSLLRLLSMQQRWRITTRRSKFMSRFANLLGKRWLYRIQAWLQSSVNAFSLDRLQHLLLSPACWSTVQRSISLGYFSHIGHSLEVYMKLPFFRASLCHLCIDALNAQHAVAK